jgi:hypothetical protein
MIIAALMLAGVQASAVNSDYKLVNPRAIELFEREPKLMDWALAAFDKDHDGYLSIFEADAAAQEFKSIADGDKDGQVTPAEFQSAMDFVVARYVRAKAPQPTSR